MINPPNLLLVDQQPYCFHALACFILRNWGLF